MFSGNLRCQLISLHGHSRTYRVASLRAGPVGYGEVEKIEMV